MTYRILFVGLTPALFCAAQAALAAQGTEVITMSERELAEPSFGRAAPDLILVEGGLKNPSTSEFLRRFKSSQRAAALPIIVYGGELTELERIVAFELGADDVLGEPMSEREFVLRVNAILRRVYAARRSGYGAIELGPLTLEEGGMRARLNGIDLGLTSLEARLLYELAEGEGRAKTREELIRRVWRGRYPNDSRTLDTHIRRLRKKLGWAGQAIETLRGTGYRLSASLLSERSRAL